MVSSACRVPNTIPRNISSQDRSMGSSRYGNVIMKKKLNLIAMANQGAQVRSMFILENRGIIVSGVAKGIMRIWNFPYCKMINETKVHEERVICLFPFRHHNTEVSLNFLLCLKRIHSSNKALKIPKPIQKNICNLMNKFYIVTGSTDKQTKLWKMGDEYNINLETSFSVHKNNINDGLQFDIDTFVTISVDSNIFFYSFSKRKALFNIKASGYDTLLSVKKLHFKFSNSEIFKEEREYLLVGAFSGSLLLFDYQSKNLIASTTLPSPVGIMALSKSHPTIAYVGCDDSSVK
eukprot:TRINITY_DN5485_c0_g1_i1.p1 TRINITY_DN5485_c0_g1~~TRINITY_DN5485_c0_g1_i1.p1  ORF type:complete len:292 (+),score=65.50 TRINITY_DN5485_c0_g1_i1:150-1025(+)